MKLGFGVTAGRGFPLYNAGPCSTISIHQHFISIQPILCKRLGPFYSQLCVIQYGEFDRWFPVGVKVRLTINSPNTIHTFFSGQFGRIKVRIFGTSRVTCPISLNYVTHKDSWKTVNVVLFILVTIITSSILQ